MDPGGGAILDSWIWVRGGANFGVPVSNFLGWYLTVYVIYQLFALYLRRHPTNRNPLPSKYLRQAVLFYGVSAAGNILLIVPRFGLSATDPTGTQWRGVDIARNPRVGTLFSYAPVTPPAVAAVAA